MIVVGDSGEDHGLVSAQVVVHADAEQGLEQDCLMINKGWNKIV